MKINLDETLVINEIDDSVICDITDCEPQLMLLVIKELISERDALEDKITVLNDIIEEKNNHIEMMEDNWYERN